MSFKKVSQEDGFYPRILLTLEVIRARSNRKREAHNSRDNDENKNLDILTEIINNLQSPLKLALILIDAIFTDGGVHLRDYKDNLDETKKVAFGLGRAEILVSSGVYDKLALYSLYQFAFQQYVHRSFEARQGKALENILAKILESDQVGVKLHIAPSKSKKIEILKEVFCNEKLAKDILERHDIDILAEVSDKVLILQMRSRDDTGGATAKSSLAELLRDLYRADLQKEILYIIYVWVKPESSTLPQQKITLINKLLDMIDLERERVEEIKEKLKNGEVVELKEKLKVCILYGAKELVSTILTEVSERDEISSEITNKIIEEYSKYLELVSMWDDLWLSYAIATLELENLVKYGKTNAMIFEEKLTPALQKKLSSSECLENYRECSAEMAKEISPYIRGRDDIIPFSALGDKLNYIRDLLILRIVYEHLEEICNVIGVDPNTRKKLHKLQKIREQGNPNKRQGKLDKFVKIRKGEVIK
ncbi:hypothetical protein P8X24_07490 [Pyrococcus kukulkanii]|uniref:hypothetical protein n=1 Tax=Pyrococcus kukulkanii TaxID=1609559 RepID=UPI0035658F01